MEPEPVASEPAPYAMEAEPERARNTGAESSAWLRLIDRIVGARAVVQSPVDTREPSAELESPQAIPEERFDEAPLEVSATGEWMEIASPPRDGLRMRAGEIYDEFRTRWGSGVDGVRGRLHFAVGKTRVGLGQALDGTRGRLGSVVGDTRSRWTAAVGDVRGRVGPAVRSRLPNPQAVAQWIAVRRTVWACVAAVLLLFGFGWMLGGGQDVARREPGTARAAVGWSGALGFGGARYDCIVTSVPESASIVVDGKRVKKVTPAILSLPAGEHRITLGLPNRGSRTFVVRGNRGEQVTLDAPLYGSIRAEPSDDDLAVSVSVDGAFAGYAPTTVTRLAPGPHYVEFSTPRGTPWGQVVDVRVNQVRSIVARPLITPAMGEVEIRATLTDEGEADPLRGARVWVDGQLRGSTPLVLKLPRGPYSVRAQHQGEHSPVQIVDLPGGNKRFVDFQFGSDFERPELHLLSRPQGGSKERLATFSAQLLDVGERDLSEMWVHLRTPEGPWRRYPMALLEAPGGVVGVVVISAQAFHGVERPTYYVSALTTMGDEYFTEMQNPISASARSNLLSSR